MMGRECKEQWNSGKVTGDLSDRSWATYQEQVDVTPSCTQATLPNLARRSRSWIKKRRKIRTPRYCAYRTKREANKGRTKATLKATHKKERHIPSGYPMDTIWMPSGYRGHMRKACGEHAEGMRSALPIDANSNAPFSAPHGARRWAPALNDR